MIDLVLHAPDLETLAAFARNRGLQVLKGRIVDEDPDSPTFGDALEAGEWVNRRGFEYTPWAGSGKFMRTKGTYDNEGVELTPPQYVEGLVYHIRLHGAVADEDVADEDETETDPQAKKSKIVRWARRNGTLGSIGGGALNYAEVDGVKILLPAEVNAWIDSRGLAGHEWLGGNSY